MRYSERKSMEDYAAEEMYRNAYEGAYGKYIDNKIDKLQFKKLYSLEIYNLVNDEHQKEFYAMNQSKYARTLAVYKEMV